MNFACLSKCRSSGSKRPSKVGFCGHCCGDIFSVGWMADDIRHVQSDETCPKVVALPTIDQNDSDLHPPDDASIRRVATGFHTKIVLPPNWAFVSTLQLSRAVDFAASLQVQNPLRKFPFVATSLRPQFQPKLKQREAFPYLRFSFAPWLHGESLPLVEHTLPPAFSEQFQTTVKTTVKVHIF